MKALKKIIRVIIIVISILAIVYIKFKLEDPTIQNRSISKNEKIYTHLIITDLKDTLFYKNTSIHINSIVVDTSKINLSNYTIFKTNKQIGVLTYDQLQQSNTIKAAIIDLIKEKGIEGLIKIISKINESTGEIVEVTIDGIMIYQYFHKK